MYVSRHIIWGFIFSLLILLLFPQIELIGFFLIWSSSVLIDFDHYVYYIYKKKDWSLMKAYNWNMNKTKQFLSLSRKERNKTFTGFFIFHGLEILIILFILGIFLSRYFFFISLGILFHTLLDIVYSSQYMDRFDKFSLILDIFKFKKLKFID